MPDAILDAQDVSLRYRRGATVVNAVAGVTVRFKAGVVTLITGPSGSGKTSLLAILGCMVRPDEGRLVVAGQAAAHISAEERARLRAAHIGFVFQAFRLFRALSAIENVELGAGLRPLPAGRAQAMLEWVGLADRGDTPVERLSGGERQRVAIARALSKTPKVLLADEPTASLDARSGESIGHLLRRSAREYGSAVVIVSHDPRLEPFADRILTMEDGRVVSERGSSCGV